MRKCKIKPSLCSFTRAHVTVAIHNLAQVLRRTLFRNGMGKNCSLHLQIPVLPIIVKTFHGRLNLWKRVPSNDNPQPSHISKVFSQERQQGHISKLERTSWYLRPLLKWITAFLQTRPPLESLNIASRRAPRDSVGASVVGRKIPIGSIFALSIIT